MNSVFNEQLLADKFSKLNSTQQCIETLSHLCIFHRSKAELVVATWNTQFHNSEMIQKVPLLYLANDILQNSKRKGNEFVTEFWKVLPAALKDVNEKGDDHGKKVVSRLVDIWEQRRVFGSRPKSLKEIMLAEELPPPLEFNKKRSRSVRIVKRDSRSIRTKLSIGGTAEKIVSAFHLVLSENASEDAEMNKCKSAVHRVRKMEEDVDVACSSAKDPKRKTLAKELEEEENILKQCIEKLKSIEANRVALVSQLREALQEQESELENVRTQMQVAQAQVEEASTMKKRLSDDGYVAVPKSSNGAPPPIDANAKSRKTSKKTAAAIAAEVADKLAASSSSQYIMSSVLSTLAAEEAKNASLSKTSATSSSFTTMLVNPVTNSMPNPENSMSVSDPNGFMQAQPLSAPPNNLYQSVLVSQPTLQTPAPISQAQYQILQNPPSQQYMQHSGVIMAPYGYGNPPLPPGPPPPPMQHLLSMVPLTQQQLQISQQQPPAPPSFRPLQPPGMVYYSHPHHS